MIFEIKKKLMLLTVLFGMASLHATPDLTVVGFIQPEGGLGKVPITILETLGSDIDANVITTFGSRDTNNLPEHTVRALTNPVEEPGKVGIITNGVWHIGAKPNNKVPDECGIKLAYSMMESTEIPSTWTKVLNEQYDAVVVPDKYLVKVYENSGVTIPIFVLPLPMILSPYLSYSRPAKDPLKPFIFGDASANKNPEPLIHAFAMLFRRNLNVQLVLRAAGIQPQIREKIENLIKKYKLKNVTLEEGPIPLDEYIKKLASFDCYVNLSHGEGFSYIPRESLALGIPVIITNNTSSTTVCESGFVRAVPSTKKCRSSDIYDLVYGERCGEQFDCELNDVIKALRDVYENYSLHLTNACRGREWVKKYDCENPVLKGQYRALIKPKSVFLGDDNCLLEDTLITNSPILYEKYSQIISER